MTRAFRYSWYFAHAAIFSVMLAAACDGPAISGRDTPELRRDLRAACDSGVRYPYLLDLHIGGPYVVNGEHMDSSRLVHWLSDRVRTYPEAKRRLVVFNDSTRYAELIWIVRTAHQAGVTVYDFLPRDSVCYPSVR